MRRDKTKIPEPMKEPKFLFEIKPPIAMLSPNKQKKKKLKGDVIFKLLLPWTDS